MNGGTVFQGLSSGRGARLGVTLAFAVLGFALSGLMTWYRKAALEPRLREEAMAQAEILSESKALSLVSALRSGVGAPRRAALEAAVDELLLLRDRASDTPYFDWVAIEVDHGVVGASPSSLDLRKGAPASTDSFPTKVALYDSRSLELLGVARFGVSTRLFRELSARVGEELSRVTLAFLALLLVLWAVLLAALSKLDRQTERRFAAEHELSQREKQYERLVNNLSQYFVYRKDAKGRVLTVSDSVARVLGFAPQEFAFRQAESLRPTAPLVSGSADLEVEIDDAEGEKHRLELSEVPVMDEAGRVVAYDGIARDATVERRFRKELQHAKEEAEGANRAKSRFLANMSHEIRTPLNAILGMAGLALRTVRETKERDYLEKIRASARLLAEIIEDILDLSRVEAGRLDLVSEPFDLGDMLAEISDVIGAKAGLRGLEVTFQPQGPLPQKLVGDVVRLKQVLLNLLSNAVKFTERGEIVVRIERVEVRRDRAALRFTVTDTGIGIPMSDQPAIFEPFTQVDTSNSRRYGGLGLGLAISRRLVRLMGGDIAMTSEVGVGSTFTFTVALGLAEGHEEWLPLPKALQGVRALVVDDHESARLALKGMLEMLTCRVDAVPSGEEALIAYANASPFEPYRVALVDWKMPGLDGIETSSGLKGLAGKTPLSLILVTAHDWGQAAQKAEAAGIATVLHKPLSPSGLHDALVTTLSPGERLRAPSLPAAHLRFASGQTVLLVEDQAINRELACELLTLAGLRVAEATNGREGLAYLENSRPAAVLMDVQMPHMDGLTAVGLIRKDPRLADLPVIAMTAHAMLGDRERFLDAGMSDYVAKPIDEEQLLRVLSRWLEPEARSLRGRSLNPSAAQTPSPKEPSTPRSVDPPRDAPAETEYPVLDRRAGLRRAGGNQNLYERLLRGFVTETPALLGRMALNSSRGRRDEVRLDLHALKGNAATLGAMAISALAAELEREPAAIHSTQAFSRLNEEVSRLSQDVPVLAAEPAPARLGAILPALTAQERAEAVSRLARLAGHVAGSNLAARRSLAELRAALRGSFPDSLAALDTALDHLDFEAAAQHIEELQARLSAQESA